MKRRLIFAGLLVLALVAQCVTSSRLLGVARAAAPPMYRVVDLGTLGGSFATPRGINNYGQVVGWSSLAGDPRHPLGFLIVRGFHWVGGQMRDIGTLGGSNSFAFDINDTGQIAGASYLTGDPPDSRGVPATHAFLYRGSREQSGGSMTDLGTLGGLISGAEGINNAGQVVGVSTRADGRNRGFIYSNGVMRDIGAIGGSITFAFAINNNGLVVGRSGIPGDLIPHAFLYNDSTGVMTDLGTLGGTSSEARSINFLGRAVGSSFLTGNPRSPEGITISHAFLSSGGGLIDLGTLTGDTFSNALSINGPGWVVGVSFDRVGGSFRGFLYSEGAMRDLNTLIPPDSGWQINYAYGINDVGQIIGAGTINGQQRAVLLTTPVQSLSNLVFLVQNSALPLGIRISLLVRLYQAVGSTIAGNFTVACNQLNGFINQVNAQSGRAIPVAQADQLIAVATQTRAVLGCQ